jgi:hypothetical protein
VERGVAADRAQVLRLRWLCRSIGRCRMEEAAQIARPRGVKQISGLGDLAFFDFLKLFVLTHDVELVIDVNTGEVLPFPLGLCS